MKHEIAGAFTKHILECDYDYIQTSGIEETKKALQTGFRTLKKERGATLWIDDKYCLSFDSTDDRENDILTIHISEGIYSRDIKKASFEKAKKDMYEYIADRMTA